MHFLLLLTVAALAALAVAATASAGRSGPHGPNLVTTIQAPGGVTVYTSGHWGVTVANTGDRDASGVAITVQLPRTANSPTQYLMGTLGAISSGCARSGFAIVCQPRTIKKNRSTTLSFDITLPYSTNPIAFTADAQVTGEINPADNTATATAALATVAVAFTPTRSVLNTHCTGGPTLSSFVECVPGSTSSFVADLLPGPGPGSGPVSVPAAGATGTWTLAGSGLTIVYTDISGAVQATFVGQGVDVACWEGKTTFPGNTQYISIYRVCLQ